MRKTDHGREGTLGKNDFMLITITPEERGRKECDQVRIEVMRGNCSRKLCGRVRDRDRP
jgi:hypothetical protein